MTGLPDPCHVRKSAVHCRLSASLERASRGPLSQVTSTARQAVLDSIQCIICQDVVQLPVSIICFSGCPGTHARANNTCLRGVLCQHCANDGLQLNRPASERFSEERGRVRCMICRHTAVDSRQLTPVKAYAVNHALMDVMDAVDIGATCRKCEEDFPSQMALQAHYQKHCRHAVVQCRFKGCPQVGLRPLIDVHQETCTVGRAMCQQCKERVDKDELVYHMVANCRMRVVVCVLCSHRARLPDMLLHLRLHQAQLQLQILQKGSVPAAAAAISSRSRQAAAAFQASSGLPGQQQQQQQRHAAWATSQAVAVTLQAGMMQAAQGTGSFAAATPGGDLLASGPRIYNNPFPTGVQGAVSAALANPVLPTATPITSEAFPTVPATTAHGAAAAEAVAGWSAPSAHPNLQAGGAAVMAAAALAHANGSMGTVNGSVIGSRAALPAATVGAPEVTLLPGSMLHANQHQMLHDMLQRLRRRQQQQQQLQQLQQRLLQQQQQESLVQAAPAAHGQPQSPSVTQPGGNQQAALLSVPLPSPLHQPQVQGHVQQQLQHSSQVVTTNQAASIHGEWPEYQLLPAQRHRQMPAQMYPPPVHATADAGTMRASLSGTVGADLTQVPPAVVGGAALALATGGAASFERGTVQAGLAGIDRTSRSSDLTEASSSVATCLREEAGWQQQVASVPTASEAGRSGRPSDGQVTREDSDSGSSAGMLTGILDEYGAGLLQTLSDALVGPVAPSNAQALRSGARDVPMLVTISPAMFRHRSSDFVGYTSESQRAAGHQARHARRFADINSSEDSDGDGGGSDAGLASDSERLERAWAPDLPAAQLQAQVQPQEGDGSSCEGQQGTYGGEGDDTAAADLHRAQPRAAEMAGLGNCLSPLEGFAQHTRLTNHAASADRYQASTYLAPGGLAGPQLGAGDGERVSCASDQQGTPSEGGSRRQHGGRSVRAISMQHRRLAALCSAAECIGVGGRSWGGSPHRSDAPQRRRAGSVDAPGPRRRRLSDSEAIHVSRQELAMATQAVAAMLLCPAADQAEEQV